MDSFDRQKNYLLKEIGLNSETNPDASPKGTIDTLCIPLIKLINSHKDMVTTSTCSGRLSVFLEGEKLAEKNQKFSEERPIKIGAKGDGGHWLFVSHDKDEINEWWRKCDLSFNYECESLDEDYDTKTRDFKSASRLYSTAMGCGFRESGIGANNNVAIRISIRLDVPIGFLNNKNEVVCIVSESYLKMVTKLAHDRFLENERKMEQLYERIDQEVIHFVENSSVSETKEERRQRKIKEGMAIRDEVRKQKEEKRRLKLLQLENEAATYSLKLQG
ncbi:hypothetical protein CANINC_003146 [Pichia inconspicua]|uniref:tRNA wybutosine-synthesizing protein 3 n=1 Tax=Pichia inconspicua TaxID=52247 RepID=A0A4V4NFJ6_9ASCO|nr:hypothetical protein CANINC_003146 [[Candida] inconspicua]